jgi:3D (Asp-Asp-Asp) domain-containing protein
MFLGSRDTPVSGRFAAAAFISALALGLALAFACFGGGAQAKKVKLIVKPGWMRDTLVTEYYPARESWFVGARVDTPGVSSRQGKIDWLYSAHGIAMEGDGLGTDGNRYHIESVGSGGWVARSGKKAVFGSSDKSKSPFWRSSGYWRNKKKGVTFPLHDGGWFAGKGKRWVAPKGITFGKGPSRDLTYYRSVAVDPKRIPMGSLVWIGLYKDANGDGWFRAEDTGGAIVGNHLDAYIKPPQKFGPAESNAGQRVYVVPKAKIAAYVRAQTAKDTDGLPLPPKSLQR